MKAHAISKSPDLSRDRPEIGGESLPLVRNAGGRFAIVPLDETGQEQGIVRLEARRGKVRNGCRVHRDGLHQLKVVEMALGANLLRSQAELISERTSECLVRGVPRVESDPENV